MSEQLPSYKTITEVFDWGAAISKIIIKWPEIIESEMVNKDTFKVYVRRILSEGAFFPSSIIKKEDSNNLDNTSNSENDLNNYREITNAYVSNEKGIKQEKDQFITIERHRSAGSDPGPDR